MRRGGNSQDYQCGSLECGLEEDIDGSKHPASRRNKMVPNVWSRSELMYRQNGKLPRGSPLAVISGRTAQDEQKRARRGRSYLTWPERWCHLMFAAEVEDACTRVIPVWLSACFAMLNADIATSMTRASEVSNPSVLHASSTRNCVSGIVRIREKLAICTYLCQLQHQPTIACRGS